MRPTAHLAEVFDQLADMMHVHVHDVRLFYQCNQLLDTVTVGEAGLETGSERHNAGVNPPELISMTDTRLA